MDIVVPQLGESVIEARVARWLKQEGDAVAAGEPLVELETDKIDLEVNAESAGTLARIQRKEGEDVKVGEVLGVLEAGGAGVQPRPAEATEAPEESGAEAPPPQVSGPKAPPPQEMAAELKITPTARRMADDHRVDLAQVRGSGEGGRITKDDVLRFVAGASKTAPAAAPAPAPAEAQSAKAGQAPAPAPAPAPAAARPPAPAGARVEERVRMSKRRATIAKRLVEAQRTAAMLTTFNEVDMSAVQALRARRKEAFQKRHGVGLGLSSFFVKAVVGALKAFPRINAEIQGDEMVLKRYYDIGIAVGASSGLVVPVLRDADRMTFWEIEAGIKDFAKRAEEGSLTLEEITGGTFTITNGGVFGSLLSTPILNPPQVGILGMHKIEERPIAVGGQVVVRPMMYVALSYDHRIVDGLEAVQFLVKLKEFIEDPGHLLIEG